MNESLLPEHVQDDIVALCFMRRAKRKLAKDTPEDRYRKALSLGYLYSTTATGQEKIVQWLTN